MKYRSWLPFRLKIFITNPLDFCIEPLEDVGFFVTRVSRFLIFYTKFRALYLVDRRAIF